jgi:hypothetical protein
MEAKWFPLEAVAFVFGIDELTEVGSTCKEKLDVLALEVLLPKVQGLEEAALGLFEIGTNEMPITMFNFNFRRLTSSICWGISINQQ